jgi:hypothetical protein
VSHQALGTLAIIPIVERRSDRELSYAIWNGVHSIGGIAMALARNIRPNAIIRDPRAEAILVFATRRPDLDAAGAQHWLQRATDLVRALERPGLKGRVACVVTALGPSFFQAGGTPRFGLDPDQVPAGLRELPSIAGLADPLAAADVLFYAPGPDG